MRDLAEIHAKKHEVTAQVVELGLELAEQDPPLDDPRWRNMCLLLGMVDGLSWALGDDSAVQRRPRTPAALREWVRERA